MFFLHFFFFFVFSKCTLNFRHCQKKMTLIDDIFWKLRTPENVVRYMAKKSHFRGPFERQHSKRLKILKKKMTLIPDVFQKLRNPKNVVRYMSKKSRFRGTFDRQHGERAQTLLQSERKHPYHI